MKKTVVVLTFFGFFVSLAMGYYFTMNEQEKQKRLFAEPFVATVKKEITIHSDGEIIYQYYYTNDAVTKEQVEPVPDFLAGMTLKQLESVYNGWQVAYFSPEKVILRCSIEGKSTEVFMLGQNNGYLAIFYENEDKKLKLKEQTETPVAILPEGEQQQLREGIYVYGEENLARLLSDFFS